jgi:hypothetical protein
MTQATVAVPVPARTVPPLSRPIQGGVGLSLVLAGLLNGGLQYVDHLAAGDGGRRELMVWGLEHQTFYQTVWFGVMLSSIFLLVGFLGLAQLTRWHTPKLTVAATLLTLWGMWGFGNVLVGTYVAQVVTPDVLGPDEGVTLIEDGYLEDWGMVAGSLAPHLVGSFFGVLLLAVACWRAGLPRVPVTLLVVFLVWDFTFTPVGPLEPHLLLMVALVWLGTTVVRMPQHQWLGRRG